MFQLEGSVCSHDHCVAAVSTCREKLSRLDVQWCAAIIASYLRDYLRHISGLDLRSSFPLEGLKEGKISPTIQGGFKMASGLGALKRTMSLTILVVFAIFLALISFITFIFSLNPVSSFLLGVFGALLIMLFQYLIGPVIVQLSTGLQYLKPGDNPWLENKVQQLTQQSGIPMPRLALVPDNTPNAFVFGRTQKDATSRKSGIITAVERGRDRRRNRTRTRTHQTPRLYRRNTRLGYPTRRLLLGTWLVLEHA